MQSADFDRIEEVFHAARALAEPERSAYLDAECAGNAALRQEVESLLASLVEASGDAFLDEPLTSSIAQSATGADRPDGGDPHRLIGKTVGPYRVERFLGGGGMGDVYLAVRLEPFKQYVGLKIIRRGLGSDEVLRRFDFERQILASLNHTNIAKLLDGGITSDGLPYFAMEYVDGLPITRYCDRNKLTVRERLELFRSVCSAVQYAHQNLIIHRDLKPHNVLVTRNSEVKLLDFGIAKIINPNLADVPTAVTQTQYRMLTPDYASPEQVRGEPLTTASDVYSLGVMLYELLVGERPYDLSGRTPAEVERVVCEQEPLRPSTRTHTSRVEETDSADGNSAAATLRMASPDRLSRLLRGDLDNIIMMALRKEPGRRYATVDLLMQDLDNHVAGRPVLAHRDSRSYRVAKFVRRNRVQTVLGSLLLFLLVGFSLYSASQARKIASERDRAQTEALKAAEVSGFVVGLFENANPTRAPGDTITVRQILDSGVQRVERELADQPALQAELFNVMGVAYQALGRSERAVDLLERSVGIVRDLPENDQELADNLLTLGLVYNYLNRRAEAQEYLQEFVDLQTERLGPNDPEVLMGRVHLLSAMHQTQPGLVTDSMLAVWSRLESKVDELEQDEAASVMSYVADLLYSRGDYERAEEVGREGLRMYEQIHGRVHHDYITMLHRLNWTLIEMDRAEDAVESTAEAIRIAEELYPEGHRNLASAYSTRGEVLSRMGRFDEAAELHKKDIEIRIRILGDKHSTLARVYRFMGRNESRRDQLDAAAEYYQLGADVFAHSFGVDYVFARQHLLSVADVRFRQRRYAVAESLYLDTYRVFLRDRGENDRYTRSVAGDLADVYTEMGMSAKAAEYRAKANPPG